MRCPRYGGRINQYWDGATDPNGPIVLGSSDFPGLDSLVIQARQLMYLPFRNRGDLVAMVGDDLMGNEQRAYFREHARRPTEKQVIMDGMVFNTFGNLPAITPPFFPDGTVLVTSFDNLARYYQETSVRRTQRSNPECDQVEEFLSMNDGYVVQEFDKAVLIENITISE